MALIAMAMLELATTATALLKDIYVSAKSTTIGSSLEY